MSNLRTRNYFKKMNYFNACCLVLYDRNKNLGGNKMNEEKIEILNEEQYTKLIVETNEGKKVAEVTLTDATPADGYRIRLTPKYD